MPREDYFKYFRVLEVDSDASPEEIQRAYHHLKKLYSDDSLITLPIEDEYPVEKKQLILKEIEEAYMKLSIRMAEKKKDAQQGPVSEADTLPEFVIESNVTEACILKTVRENLGLTLKDLSRSADIPDKILENLELEEFTVFSQPGLVRWYVLTVAKVLNLDARETADEYMKRYRKWNG